MSKPWDVLVVDDEPVVRDAIGRVLEEEGLAVARVADVDSALAHPALATCRLVLCDVMLPGRSGIEAVPALRERRPDLPIVLITGFATVGIADRAMAGGATAFLAKPFDETELLDLVRRVLGPKQAAVKEDGP